MWVKSFKLCMNDILIELLVWDYGLLVNILYWFKNPTPEQTKFA